MPDAACTQGPNRQRRAIGIAFAAALAVLAHLPAAPAAADEGVVRFVLDNGLEAVVIPDRRAPVVTHMVWYKVGSADDPPGKSGLAHFLEHLMFKGTSNHPAGEFGRAVAEIGGQENAFTASDYTAYHQTVAPDALEMVMRYEADRMRNLVLTEVVVAPERDVIIEERSSGTDGSPESLLQEEVDATLYQNHPYRIPVIGWMHEIRQLGLEDALGFYRRYYAPNNAVLLVAGDVDPAAVRETAMRTYGKVAPGPDLRPRQRPAEPDKETRRTVTMSDPRIGVPSFSKHWVVPSYRTAAPGEAEALDLLSEILGGGIRSRLHQALVVRDGVASAAGTFFQGSQFDPTSFGVYGSPSATATLGEVEAAIDREIARLAKDGVTEAELESAKTRYVRALIFARDDQSGMANLYGVELTTGGSIRDVAEWPERIRAVTAEQIQAAARKYLDEKVAVAGYLLPADPGAN